MIKSILGGKSKNLFDKSNAQIIDGYISGSNVFSRSALDKTIIIPCLPNTTYTFSKISVSPVVNDRLRIGDYTAIPAIGDTINNVVNIGEPPTQNYITITTSDTAKYIVVTIGLFNQTVITTLDYILNTCQLELGSTATEYVPYELTSYKSIMKVSDVMQVVNKPISSTGVSLSGTSQTISGITCHYLEDGTGVTLTGTTSTAYAIFQFGVYRKPVVGHKYLWFYQHSNANDVNKAYFELKYVDKDGKGKLFSGDERIYTLVEYAEKFEFHPIVKDNATCNGFTFKPQFFDLTEMFGAGNEPKTVAEFKAKFPNDYYPYSPSCFVTSFDERMPCKTKNLFSSSTEVGVPSNTASTNTAKRLLENGKWYVGFSKNNYYRGPQSDWSGNFQYNIWENNISLYTNLDGFGLAKCVYVEPNTSYTLSYKVSGADLNVGFGFYQEDGTFIDYLSGEKITTPENCKFITVVFALGTDINKVTHYVSDIQLVKGTTATDYVPYGYV